MPKTVYSMAKLKFLPYKNIKTGDFRPYLFIGVCPSCGGAWGYGKVADLEIFHAWCLYADWMETNRIRYPCKYADKVFSGIEAEILLAAARENGIVGTVYDEGWRCDELSLNVEYPMAGVRE